MNIQIYIIICYSGDKDTFRFAWKALGSEYFMIEYEPSCCGYLDNSNNFKGISMAQHRPDGNIIFLHRNLLKWDVTQTSENVWTTVKKIQNNSSNRSYEISFCQNGHVFMDLHGDTEEQSVIESFGDIEGGCLSHLAQIRQNDNYRAFSLDSWIFKQRFAGKASSGY